MSDTTKKVLNALSSLPMVDRKHVEHVEMANPTKTMAAPSELTMENILLDCLIRKGDPNLTPR